MSITLESQGLSVVFSSEKQGTEMALGVPEPQGDHFGQAKEKETLTKPMVSTRLACHSHAHCLLTMFLPATHPALLTLAAHTHPLCLEFPFPDFSQYFPNAPMDLMPQDLLKTLLPEESGREPLSPAGHQPHMTLNT